MLVNLLIISAILIISHHVKISTTINASETSKTETLYTTQIKLALKNHIIYLIEHS